MIWGRRENGMLAIAVMIGLVTSFIKVNRG